MPRYDLLNDNGQWLSAIVENFNAMPHVTLLSAVAAQTTGQQPFQPTVETPQAAFELQSVAFAAFTFRPLSSGLLIDILLSANYAHFSLDCHFIGYVLPADAPPLGVSGGDVIVTANRTSGRDPQWNLTVKDTSYNSSTSRYVLDLFWAPMPDVLSTGLFTSVSDFIDSQHIMHCTACVKQSAVSIAWIVLLGSFQAAAIISALVGYCIRRCNRDLQSSTGLLAERSWIQQSDDQSSAAECGLVVRRQDTAGGLEEQLL